MASLSLNPDKTEMLLNAQALQAWAGECQDSAYFFPPSADARPGAVLRLTVRRPTSRRGIHVRWVLGYVSGCSSSASCPLAPPCWCCEPPLYIEYPAILAHISPARQRPPCCRARAAHASLCNSVHLELAVAAREGGIGIFVGELMIYHLSPYDSCGAEFSSTPWPSGKLSTQQGRHLVHSDSDPRRVSDSAPATVGRLPLRHLGRGRRCWRQAIGAQRGAREDAHGRTGCVHVGVRNRARLLAPLLVLHRLPMSAQNILLPGAWFDAGENGRIVWCSRLARGVGLTAPATASPTSVHFGQIVGPLSTPSPR